jgi:GMP synthase (glutamine-hydrolysing)
VHLAATKLCAHQAYARGPNILGVQFHVEADTAELERRLIEYAVELVGAGIDPGQLRAEAVKIGPALEKAATAMFSEWLGKLIF